jgi:single-stranded-DNA-specific exonuclease
MQRPEGMRNNRWQVAPHVPEDISQELGHIHPILLQILYNRRISRPGEIQAFLEGRYLSDTDPYLLEDMDGAVSRIQLAIENDERIVIYGDFDADGVTATVLLTEALRGFGVTREQAQPYIPDRVDEGYGLNTEALTRLRKERGADLVITVDCGIRSPVEVAEANELGLDVIITDHHSLGPQIPPAVAVINPNRSDSKYPEAGLAGVGIAYKLAQALRQAMPERARFQEDELLDLVALGTVADLAPLQGENRQLVTAGLMVLNRGKRPGVAALSKVARIKPGAITAQSIGFGLGPRINAAGRLDHAYLAARLLAANNRVMADKLATELNDLNRKRQRLTAELCDLAEGMVDADPPIIVAVDPSFRSGVVGLVASRLSEKYYRPAIVMEMGEEECRASCRSIPEFHITHALDEIEDLMVRHGGHSRAAGFTVRNDKLPELIERITEIARGELEGRDLRPVVDVDMEIELDEVDWALQENLTQLEPTGEGNAAPVFMSKGVEVVSHRVVGQEGTHLQMRLIERGDGSGSHKVVPAIAFRQGAWVNRMPQHIDIVYTINVNEWNGRRDLQLVVKDIRPADG